MKTLIKFYLKLVGKLACIIGYIDKYSPEHMKFLSSGFECGQCGKTLIKCYGIANVNCYNESNEKVSIMLARLKGKYFECPKCKYCWDIRK